MDISVNQLNHRLALQLPAELPLGLVFVTGMVRNLEKGGEMVNGRTTPMSFDLEQKEHRLRCKLVQREVGSASLREQMEVRLGGHLIFDPRRAEYFLLARDVEVVDAGEDLEGDPLAVDLGELVGDEAAFTAALTGIKRRADVSRQSPATVPIWVQKLAPPELQEDNRADEPDEEDAPVLAVTALAAPVLNEELVTYLSGLMDSEEDVELTPDILAQWKPEPVMDIPDDIDELLTAVPPTAETDMNEEEVVTAVSPYDPVGDAAPKPKSPRPKSPPPRQQTDWAVILLLVAMVVLTIVILFAAIVLR